MAGHDGRNDAGIRWFGQLSTLVGAVGGGALATAIGVRAALALSAAMMALAALVAASGLRGGSGDGGR